MNEYEFTTQYVSGMTKIPPRTIQEYVSTFRDHFSPKAGQPKKGRRFLAADIDKLQMIQRLRAERVPDDEINQILTGELPFKLAHQFSEAEIKNMAAHSLEIFGRAELALEKAEEFLHNAEKIRAESFRLHEQTKRENISMRNQLNRIEQTLTKFRQWQLFVMKHEPEFNIYAHEDRSEPLSEEMPREEEKGFIGKLLGK